MFIGDIAKGTEVSFMLVKGEKELAIDTVAVRSHENNGCLAVKVLTLNGKVLRFDKMDTTGMEFYINVKGTQSLSFRVDDIDLIHEDGRLYHALKSSDKRDAFRVDMKTEAVIELGNKKLTGRIVDISTSGAGLVVYESVDNIPLGGRVHVSFSTGVPRCHYDVSGKLVRKHDIDGDGSKIRLGIKFNSTPQAINNLIMQMQIEDIRKRKARII